VASTSRVPSRSKIVAAQYHRILSDRGVGADFLSLDEIPASVLQTTLYHSPKQPNEEWEGIQQRVHLAQKFVFVIPEYNGSFPGILKVWVDALEFPGSLRGKKACMLGLSDGTQGAALAMGHFADVLNYAGVHTLAFRPRFIHIGKYISEGALVHPEYLNQMQVQAGQFLAF